jgi:hypothetical protein
MFIGGASRWENAETPRGLGPARAMFTAHNSKRGTRGQLVEVTVEVPLY